MDSELRAGTLFAVFDGKVKYLCDCLLDVNSDLMNLSVRVVHPQEIRIENEVGTLNEILVDISGFKIGMPVYGLPMRLDKNTDFNIHFNV